MREMRTPAVYNARRDYSQGVAEEIIRGTGRTEAGSSPEAGEQGLRRYWRSLREVMHRRSLGGEAGDTGAAAGNSGIHHATRHKRSIEAGGTDYGSVSLPDVVEDIRDWSRACDAVSARLVVFGDEIAQFSQSPTVRMAESFIDHFLSLMSRYQHDLDRLTVELPQGVQQHHAEIATRLYESSAEEERVCADFARHVDFDALVSLQALADALQGAYLCARDAMIEMRDLGNIVPRLRTLAAHGPPP
jgi:hypothetical protein